jgi:DNA-binding MarR family transcriptional regulator
MSEEKKLSYVSLVRTFLRKPELSKIYNLDVYQREILRVIANYLDMPFGSCFAKQKVLAEECGMSVDKFKDASKQLVDKKLLERKKCPKLYHYNLSTLKWLLAT